jgi:hypothetical protein
MSSHPSSGGINHGHPTVRSTPVVKPLLNQLQSSISGQFRRMERSHTTLNTKLDQSVRHMHTRIWKLKSRESADDLSNWSTAEDLRTYLTAMSLLGSSSGGGGRTFGKEKHNFFTNVAHFKESLEQARAKKKEDFLHKLKRMGIPNGSKKAAFLWQHMCERDGDASEAQPMEEISKEVKNKSNEEQKEEEEEDVSVGPEPDLTIDDEEKLRTLARLDLADPSNHDSIASIMGHSASHHHRAGGLSTYNDNNVTTLPYGVSVPGRRIGQSIIAPKVFKKASWELEEEAEERAEAAAAEAARKAEEERIRKEEAQKEEQRQRAKQARDDAEAAAMQPRGRHAVASTSTGPASAGATQANAVAISGLNIGGTSRRASLVRTGSATASTSSSHMPTPLASRRASVVGGVASALRAAHNLGGSAKRRLQILPGKSLVSSGAQLTDDQFRSEADRVMGLVFANPGLSTIISQSAESADESSDDTGEGMDAFSASRDRDRPMSIQEEIDRWNAKTPISSRSILENNAGASKGNGANSPSKHGAQKSILELAAEKLGVSSMDAVGAKRQLYTPTADPASLTAAYLASFEERMPHLAAAYDADQTLRSSPRPISARRSAAISSNNLHRRMHNTSSVNATGNNSFGHSMTSTVSNIHSTNSAIDFKDKKPRKEIVSLGSVSDPAELFAGVEKDSGSTLLPFEQLHTTNRALAEEARRRAEQAATDRAAAEIIVQRQQERDAVEVYREDAQRDKLAQKSRARHFGHTPSKSTLNVSASAGQLLSLISPSNSHSSHDYVHLSPLLGVPRWSDVTRTIDYGTLVPGYTPPPPPAPVEVPTVIVKTEILFDADGFPISDPNHASGQSSATLPSITASLPATPAPVAVTGLTATPSLISSPSTDALTPDQLLAQQRRRARLTEIRQINAQLDEEGWEGSLSARKLEIRRRRREASVPSPIQTGPSVFQQQKAVTLKNHYSRFVAATRDPHQMHTHIVRERDDASSKRFLNQR